RAARDLAHRQSESVEGSSSVSLPPCAASGTKSCIPSYHFEQPWRVGELLYVCDKKDPVFFIVAPRRYGALDAHNERE
ncbi:MAG: hypothetical protein WA658_11730, partial [Candidatus Acidiferrales bacterium]